MPCPTITTIQKTECIGNSLPTINNNFQTLRDAICEIESGVAVLQSGESVSEKTAILNFIGEGVDVTASDNIVNIEVPGFRPLVVSNLEEQGCNTGGGRNNFFILNDGTMRVCGLNDRGELGIGAINQRIFTPRMPAFNPPIEQDEFIDKIYAQGNTTYVITTNGRLYGCGQNDTAQLGKNNFSTGYTVFTQIAINGDFSPDPVDPIVELATGSGGTSSNVTVFARTGSGQLWVWGNNSLGQAGIGQATTTRGLRGCLITPTIANTFTGVCRRIVSAGNSGRQTTFAINENNKLFVVGRNQDGQAGIGTASPINILSFTEVTNLPRDYQINNILVGGTGDNISTWVTLQDGTLWAAGFNTNSQVTGTNNTVVQRAFIRVGGFSDDEFVEDIVGHCDNNSTTIWALIRDGDDGYRLKGWGDNFYGQLGFTSPRNSGGIVRVPVAIRTGPVTPTFRTVTIRVPVKKRRLVRVPDGTVKIKVPVYSGPPNQRVIVDYIYRTETKWRTITQTYTVLQNQNVLVPTDITLPRNIESRTKIVTKWTRQYYAFVQGELEPGNLPLWPWEANGAKIADIVVAGNNRAKTTLVLDTDGMLWAAGFNGTGLLGNGTRSHAASTRFTPVLYNPTLGTPIQIRSTNNDSSGNTQFANFYALLDTGVVLGWGYDAPTSGQLGIGTAAAEAFGSTIPCIVQIVK